LQLSEQITAFSRECSFSRLLFSLPVSKLYLHCLQHIMMEDAVSCDDSEEWDQLDDSGDDCEFSDWQTLNTSVTEVLRQVGASKQISELCNDIDTTEDGDLLEENNPSVGAAVPNDNEEQQFVDISSAVPIEHKKESESSYDSDLSTANSASDLRLNEFIEESFLEQVVSLTALVAELTHDKLSSMGFTLKSSGWCVFSMAVLAISHCIHICINFAAGNIKIILYKDSLLHKMLNGKCGCQLSDVSFPTLPEHLEPFGGERWTSNDSFCIKRQPFKHELLERNEKLQQVVDNLKLEIVRLQKSEANLKRRHRALLMQLKGRQKGEEKIFTVANDQVKFCLLDTGQKDTVEALDSLWASLATFLQTIGKLGTVDKRNDVGVTMKHREKVTTPGGKHRPVFQKAAFKQSVLRRLRDSAQKSIAKADKVISKAFGSSSVFKAVQARLRQFGTIHKNVSNDDYVNELKNLVKNITGTLSRIGQCPLEQLVDRTSKYRRKRKGRGHHCDKKECKKRWKFSTSPNDQWCNVEQKETDGQFENENWQFYASEQRKQLRKDNTFFDGYESWLTRRYRKRNVLRMRNNNNLLNINF
ncbi:hypothetical protein T4E_6065, partial [Trichinella pseudospiralis]